MFLNRVLSVQTLYRIEECTLETCIPILSYFFYLHFVLRLTAINLFYAVRLHIIIYTLSLRIQNFAAFFCRLKYNFEM